MDAKQPDSAKLHDIPMEPFTEKDYQESEYDPYRILPDDIQEPPKTFRTTLRQIGPGLILTASIVGTGELIATTNLGATAGFFLLWLVILSCFIKVFVQIEMGRYTLSSGETALQSFHRVPFLGSFLCWWWLIMMLMTQFQIGAMIGGVGYALHLGMPHLTYTVVNLFPGTETYLTEHPEVPWALIITPITMFILVVGRYHLVERFSTWLVALFTLVTVICVVLLPWVGTTMAMPDVEPTRDYSKLWIVALTMIGITGVGATELVAYPYWCLEKRYARYVGPRENSDAWVQRALGWMRVMHCDAWVSMLIYTLATIAFYILGAAILFRYTEGRGLEGNVGQVLDTLARMYRPVLGDTGSIWFITIGGFIVLYSTWFAATAGNSRITADFLRVEKLIPFQPPEYRYRWIRALSVLLPLFGLILFLFAEDPVVMIIIGGISQAATLPILAGIAIYLRYWHTDARLVKRGYWDFLLWLSFIIFLVAAGWGIWSQVGKYLY